MITVHFTTGTTNGVLNGNAIQIAGARVYFGKVGGAMTKTEIMNVVKNIRNYLASGNPIWDRATVNEAMNTAIEALERTDTHECVKQTHECDTISRHKALNLVLDVCNDVMDECETVTGICGEEVYTDVREVDAILKCNKRIRNGIRLLPSEPVGNSDTLKGKWNVYEVANTEEEQPIAWECSECGEVVEVQYNFCPNCGADMRGEQNE